MLPLIAVLGLVTTASTCVEAVTAQSAACLAEQTCRTEAEACRTLAFDAEGAIEGRRGKARGKVQPSPSDVQPARPAAAAGSSCVSAASGAAVDTVGTGAACVQATGATKGTQTTVSITLNPLGLATMDDAKSFAEASRLTDLTLVVPASTTSEGTFPTFVGLRANVDVVGLANGAMAYQRITAAYEEALKRTGRLMDQLLAALMAPGRTEACVDAVATVDEGAIESLCRVPIATAAQQVTSARDEVRARLAGLRREIDHRHGGLHLEVDLPMRNLDQGQIPLRIAGQAQGSLRTASAGWSAGVSGAVGASYVKPQLGDGASALTWKVAGTADAGVEETAVHASVGFSGNAGKLLDEGPAPLVTGMTGHFVDLQVRVSVPLTAGSGVTAVLSWPVSTDNERHGATFSISFDGAYLLSAAAAR